MRFHYHRAFLITFSMILILAPVIRVSAETYITEEHVQIDRCACAWFISRFLDESPTFDFIKQGQKPPTGVTYDFFGADYFHKGPDCSFTGFIKKNIKKKNPALISINTVVNDVFAWRNGPNSLSISIKKHIDHLAESGKTDHQIYQECLVIFDLLYLCKKGSSTDMHKAGKQSLPSLEKQLLVHIYGDQLPLTNKELEAVAKASTQPTLNHGLLGDILKNNEPKKGASLYALASRILSDHSN